MNITKLDPFRFAELDLWTYKKTYTDWPTFPQIYLDGEFYGGLGIGQNNLKIVLKGLFLALIGLRVKEVITKKLFIPIVKQVYKIRSKV